MLVVLGVLIFGGSNEPKVETVLAKRADLIQEVSVNGRVKPAQDVDLAFKQSGRVAAVRVAVGDSVAAGQTLVRLDTTEAELSIRDAELQLADAKLALDKLQNEATDALTEAELKEAYEDGLTAAAGVFSELYVILDDLDSLLFGVSLSTDSTENNIKYYVTIIDGYDARYIGLDSRLAVAHAAAEKNYDIAFTLYEKAQRGGDEFTEEAILATYSLTQDVLNIIKSARDAIQFFKDKSSTEHWAPLKPETVNAHLANLASYHSTVNGYLLSLLDSVNAIKNKNNLLGGRDLDIRSQQLEVEKKENALFQAKEKLVDLYLRASFAGVVTRQDAKVGEIVSANVSAISIISAARLQIEANIPEVDVAKIKVGDSAEVTLDAYGDDLVFSAQVVKIDPAETIVEGVATYKTTFQFKEDDGRIKPGMTADINILAAKREGVLVVPARAMISRNGEKLVRVLTGGEMEEVVVITGLRGSDGNVEVVSGLDGGEQVVTFIEQ